MPFQRFLTVRDVCQRPFIQPTATGKKSDVIIGVLRLVSLPSTPSLERDTARFMTPRRRL
jgi:hypothetical protein